MQGVQASQAEHRMLYTALLYTPQKEHTRYLVDFDLDALAVTPSLSAGDLLLMRGDLIHKTQDADTQRVSTSIRVTYSKKTITRERLGPRDPTAKDPLAKVVLSMHQRLDALGRDEMTIEEFVASIGGARGAAR